MNASKIILVMATVLGLAGGVGAQVGPVVPRTCTVSWDPVTADTAGATLAVDRYKVYVYRAPGAIGAGVLVTATTVACPLAGVNAEGQWYAVVTAWPSGGVESAPSAELAFFVASPRVPAAPRGLRVE